MLLQARRSIGPFGAGEDALPVRSTEKAETGSRVAPGRPAPHLADPDPRPAVSR
ncbi:predicted protein [Streptomyces viridosporus ATCC 14672]|uniref:Predicted protein n=1 Tax=Streptomyces viridosporus (strain ATCC 14672 / DSM 40746 / JCM 4963 / KCTC 9882 / NRRL B-12104 / FH 1290) TaxID=566461 RepID=D6A2F0_STRV1|nr:predicted protein [Streptomyces viridosporus ATCC 14672]